jgi:hypothetical protein
MNILTIIQGLVGIYIIWAIAYLILWGIIIRARSSDYNGRTPGFGGVVISVLASIYPISIAVVLYVLDRWIFPGNSLRNQIFGNVAQSNNLASIFLPELVIFTLLSTTCLFWLEVAQKHDKSPNRKRARRAKLASFVGWILDGALLAIAFYLFFTGKDRLAAWLLWCNAGAFLIVQMVKAPTQWAMPEPDYGYRFSSFLLILLLGLLRIGIIFLGGWLYLTISKLPIATGQLSKFVSAVDTIRHQAHIPSYTDLIVTVIVLSIVWTIGVFLILYALKDRLFGKLRAWAVILLSILPLIITILVSKPPTNPLLQIIILVLGMVFGFLFLRVAPKGYIKITSIYIWTFLYTLVLGAVCFAYSVCQISYGSEEIPFMLIIQLFILMVGLAVGINARSFLADDEIQDYYGH